MVGIDSTMEEYLRKVSSHIGQRNKEIEIGNHAKELYPFQIDELDNLLNGMVGQY